MVFCHCAESSSFSLHPKNATGGHTTCTAIVSGCWHVAGKSLNPGYGFLTEVNGKRRMLQPQ
jgi:acetyl/propionyl-CoA carboxylase alpha subunit